MTGGAPSFERLSPSAGTRGADGVGGHYDRRVGAGRGDIAVVPFDGIEHFRALIESFAEIGADLLVTALDFVVDGLADIVEQAATPSDSPIEAELVGDGLAQEGHL